MRSFYTRLLFLAGIISGSILFSCPDTSAQKALKIPTYIKLNATIKNAGKKPLDSVEVRFFRKGEETGLVMTPATGKASYNLSLQSEYLITFSKTGYVTRSMSYSTYISKEMLTEIWPDYKFEVTLYEGDDPPNVQVEPIARLSFSKDQFGFQPGEFDYNQIEQKEEVKELFSTVEDELRRKQEEAAKEAALRAEADRLKREAEEKAKAEAEAKGKAEQLRKEAEARTAVMSEGLKKELQDKSAALAQLQTEISARKEDEKSIAGRIPGLSEGVTTATGRFNAASGLDKIYKEVELLRSQVSKLQAEAELKTAEWERSGKEKKANQLEQDIAVLNRRIQLPSSPVDTAALHAPLKSKLVLIEQNLSAAAKKRGEQSTQIKNLEAKISEKQQLAKAEEEKMQGQQKEHAERMKELQSMLTGKKSQELQLRGEVEQKRAQEQKVSSSIAALLASSDKVKVDLQGTPQVQGLALFKKQLQSLESRLELALQQAEGKKAEAGRLGKEADLKQLVSEIYSIEGQLAADAALKGQKEQLSRSSQSEKQDHLAKAAEAEEASRRLETTASELRQNIQSKQQEITAETERLNKLAQDQTKAASDANLRAEQLRKEAEEKARAEAEAKAKAEQMKKESEEKARLERDKQMEEANKIIDMQEEFLKEGTQQIERVIVVRKQTEDTYDTITEVDKKGNPISVKYTKNSRPITQLTYKLELERARKELQK